MIRRTRSLLAAGTVVLVMALTLSACASSNALALVRTACDHVNRSIALYDASLHAATPAEASADQAAAVNQLELAQPDAATAAGEDAQWQALMTNISDSPRLPEKLLVTSLRAQCAVADSPGGNGGLGAN